MQLLRKIMFAVCGLFFVVVSTAQNITTKPVKVAVFAPVYLDSAFNGDAYKLGRNNLPKYMLPGLDFYNGVMLAIDSLNAEKAPVEVLFYDTKSTGNPLQQVITQPELQDASMIIASFNAKAEIKPLADLALEKNIPLISFTYPNDGGTTANPFFVLVNPTLPTHLEAIFRFVHRTYPTDNITLFRRKGSIEDGIQYTFNDLNKKTPGTQLKLKTVELADSFSVADVTEHLDSNNKQNIVICGSLNEGFGNNLVKALGSSKSYHAVAIGMPTWDGLREVSKDVEIIYSTPYTPIRTDKTSLQLTDKYRLKYSGRAGDMVFKGFEAMYHFTKLLLKYDKQVINHLSDKDNKLFNDFDMQPVRSDKAATTPDYLENKKLYFIRKVDGKIKVVN